MWTFIKKKIRKSFRKPSILELNDSFLYKKTVLDLYSRFYKLESFPYWLDKDLLNNLYNNLSPVVRALELRCDAFKYFGIERLKHVLYAYKSGAYNCFSGIRTMFDDLIR